MTKPFSHLLARIFGLCLLIASVSCAASADAQAMKSLRDAMFGPKHGQDGRTQAPPKIAHFVSEDGESFILDESGGNPLIRFDGDDEVFALTATPGPKGDVVFKNDIGQPVLKSTRWGGMILFSDNRPMGDPVAATGKAEAFSPGRMSPTLLFQTLVRASRRVSIALGRNLGFDAPDVTPGTDYLYADAADVTSAALVKVAAQNNGKHVLQPIQQVQLIEGRPPSATVTNGVLVLKLDVSRGNWGGRPSSKRIVNVLMASYNVTIGH